MSVLQAQTIHFESTGNNRIQFEGSNTVGLYVGGVKQLTSNSSVFSVNTNSFSVGNNEITRRQNRVINGAMMVSQEFEGASNTVSGSYVVDQFTVLYSSDGLITSWQKSGTSPKGSPNRLHANVSSADASLAAGQFLVIQHPIEGLRVADLQWGTANAQNVILRFGAKGPAGTYCVFFKNGATDRTYVREFDLVADTDTEVIMNIPGDTSGTWNSNTSTGMSIGWGLGAGSSYQTTANTWAAGNYLGTSSTFNLQGTLGNSFELFDVGLYANPNGLDIAPEYEVPLYDEELIKCQRYWEPIRRHYFSTYTDGSLVISPVQFKQIKRITPTLTMGAFTSTGSVTLTHSAPTVNTDAVSFELTSSGAGFGRGYYALTKVNARM